MTRITHDVLEAKVQNINKKLAAENGAGFCLKFAYGGVRLCKLTDGYGGLIDISERTTRTEMAKILDAIYNTLYVLNLKTE